MLMFKTLLASVVALTALASAAAEEREIMLTNAADWAICAVYVAPAREYPRHWGAELLGAPPCILGGESRKIRFDVGGNCLIDWQFELADYPDGSVERLTFDACQADEYVLGD